MRILAVALLLTLFLAGCTSPEGPQGQPLSASSSEAPQTSTIANPSTPSQAPEPSVSEENGAITGHVTDDELIPLSGAAVVLDGATGFSARTDPEGRFTINGVPPGTHELVVEAPGFESDVRAVTVVAGETLTANIILTKLQASVVRNVTYIGDGYLDIAWSIPGFFGANQTQASRIDFRYPIDENVTAVVAVAAWQSTAPLTAKRMQMFQYINSRSCATALSHCVVGTSPLPNRWDTIQTKILEEAARGKKNQFVGLGLVPLSCGPDVCTTQPDYWAQLVYDQRYTIYTSVFYHETPGADYSPLPPSLILR